MELKVWVDGIQRVVCGITEQTTVQEVVIALAQATGRTGRYALVERWKTMEKMLPPSNHPLEVLRKWDDRAKEVQFVLKRTGASSVSENDESSVVAPERSTYRQSLPPQLKHKQKKEAILNRKEPKRKSLNITGAGSNENTATKYNTVVVVDRKNASDVPRDASGKAMQNSSKKAMTSPPFRNNSVPSPKVQVSEQKNTSASSISKEVPPPPYRHIPTPIPASPKKKPSTMPPQLRNDYVLKTPAQQSPKPVNNVQSIPHQRGSSNSSGDALSQPIRSSAGFTAKSSVQSKPNDSVKARTDFTRLVLEQQGHVNEQSQTLRSLDKEMENYQAIVRSREKANALLKKEIQSLERTIQQNESDLLHEEMLQKLLQEEGLKGNNLHIENAKYQSEVSSVSENIKKLEKRIVLLQKEIEHEANAQQQKRKEISKNRYELTELNLQKANENSWRTVSALENVEDGISNVETMIYEKQMRLEALNRELRQVNLQQFIRQTGSKVTVLPPDADKDAVDHDQITSPTNYDAVQDKKRLPPSGEKPGGVWV